MTRGDLSGGTAPVFEGKKKGEGVNDCSFVSRAVTLILLVINSTHYIDKGVTRA